MCDAEGKVAKADILAMADDDEEDMRGVAETVERNGVFFSFQSFDTDGSGGLTHEEFITAAKALGYHLSQENVKQLCREIDIDQDGIVDEEEFVKFVQANVSTTSVPPDDVIVGTIYDHLGSLGAQRGYSTALAMLKKRPEAARDRFPSNDCYKGSDWYPLHYMLTQDVSNGTGDSRAAAARARRLVATPVVLALIKAYPAAAAHRFMEGVRYPRGHFPLELAIAKGWGLGICEALLEAYPEAATTVDPATDKAQQRLESKENLQSLKGLRWLRRVAETSGADDAIVSLLPKPKLGEGRISWISGQEIAEAEAERTRKKGELEAKRKAKLEAKRKREAQRQRQLENEAKLKGLLERHGGTGGDDNTGPAPLP